MKRTNLVALSLSVLIVIVSLLLETSQVISFTKLHLLLLQTFTIGYLLKLRKVGESESEDTLDTFLLQPFLIYGILLGIDLAKKYPLTDTNGQEAGIIATFAVWLVVAVLFGCIGVVYVKLSCWLAKQCRRYLIKDIEY